MKQIATIVVTLLLLWGLVPGGGEFIENTVHFLQEGHLAHAAADGDHHDGAPEREHGCTGIIHICSCCLSLSFLPAQFTGEIPSPGRPFVTIAHTSPVEPSVTGIFHPPQA